MDVISFDYARYRINHNIVLDYLVYIWLNVAAPHADRIPQSG